MSRKVDNAIMAFAGLIAQILFIFYSTVTNALFLALMAALTILLHIKPEYREHWRYPLFLSLLAASFLYTALRPRPPKDNPFRQYSGFFGPIDKFADAFIAWIGRMKYFTSPISLAEDPGSYKIAAKEIRELIEGKETGLQTGDILLRGFDGYVDGIMIGMLGGGEGLGKYFSHAALYVGDLNNGTDKEAAAQKLKVEDRTCKWVDADEEKKKAIRNNTQYYEAGPQRVIHAMARGVFTEDIMTFLRCDYLAVLRLPDAIRLSPEDIKKNKPLIENLKGNARTIQDSLERQDTVKKEVIVEAARRSALGMIGSCYDFQFNEVKTAHSFSCSEFVYYCYKSIHCYLGLQPRIHAFMKVLLRKNTISPSDIYDAAVKTGKLQIVWKSETLRRLEKAAAPVSPAPVVE